MKKIKSKLILILILTIIILYFILKDDFNGIIDVLLNSNKYYFILAIFIIGVSDFFKSISFYYLINDVDNNYTFKDAIILTVTSNFFNGITPFSLGGQPFQLYMLKKKNNIDYTTGINILFKDFYSYQLAFVTLGVLSILINKFTDIVIYTSVVENFVIIGSLLNISVMAFALFVAFKRNNNYKVIHNIIKFLNKIKIVKDANKLIDKVDKSLDEFQKKLEEIKTNKKLMLKCYLLNLFKILVLGIATYTCFISVGITNINIFKSIILTMIVMFMASFVPIPGSSGGMEYGFIALFSTFVIGPSLNASMLLWRFSGYYFLIIIGGILFIIQSRK